MDSLSYQENTAVDNVSFHNELQYVTKKIDEKDRKAKSILDKVDQIENLVDHHELYIGIKAFH